MAAATATFPMYGQNSHRHSVRQESLLPAVMIFEFLDDGDELSESSCSSGGNNSYVRMDDTDVDDDSVDSNVNSVEENKAFWESKDQLLQATLCRTSSIETKIRKATREFLHELQLAGTNCGCQSPAAGGCRSCLRRDLSDHLRLGGFNCAICISKWRSSPDIASGEHTYLEVVDDSNSKKGEVIRVVVELNFRGEFEMARANEEYKRLVSRLPEVFVGKVERLKTLIKILCSAAKKCMADKKMHMPPWRKHKYMQAKWFGTSERMALAPPAIRPAGMLGQLPTKPRASMLTFDLVENFTIFNCVAVKVV